MAHGFLPGDCGARHPCAVECHVTVMTASRNGQARNGDGLLAYLLRGEMLVDLVLEEASRRGRAHEAAVHFRRDAGVLDDGPAGKLDLEDLLARVVAVRAQGGRVDALAFHEPARALIPSGTARPRGSRSAAPAGAPRAWPRPTACAPPRCAWRLCASPPCAGRAACAARPSSFSSPPSSFPPASLPWLPSSRLRPRTPFQCLAA